MLQLHQYERLLKAMVAHSEVSGPPERLQAFRDEKVACASMSLSSLKFASKTKPVRPYEGLVSKSSEGNLQGTGVRNEPVTGKSRC